MRLKLLLVVERERERQTLPSLAWPGREGTVCSRNPTVWGWLVGILQWEPPSLSSPLSLHPISSISVSSLSAFVCPCLPLFFLIWFSASASISRFPLSLAMSFHACFFCPCLCLSLCFTISIAISYLRLCPPICLSVSLCLSLLLHLYVSISCLFLCFHMLLFLCLSSTPSCQDGTVIPSY